ncbi:uncharacterized protein LOC107019733 [Solanum pennellii]|uniref:Uncharacterized protein LOC107019733 n=1 Tax=Solanum pennellii TaxID=28526 RepID=A0ABM1VAC6_SOLPN|nr:uncharacterized protein LOC107019733 [Solanum pennellii]
MPTSGYVSQHGYNVLPSETNRPTSSVSRTITHNLADSQSSSSSTSQLGMPSFCLQGNVSEPNTPTTNQSATPGQVLTQVGVMDMHNRLVIEPDGYTFNPDDVVGIISQKKCVWRSEHEVKICANFLKRVAHVLASLLNKARKNNKKPRWILLDDWEKLLVHWANDPRFKRTSEIGKKARSSTKGGYLHTSGAQSQGSVRRKLEKGLGRPVTQAEAFKTTHIRKKKNPEDPNVWVEPRAEVTYNRYLQALEDLRQTQPEENRGLSSSHDDKSMKKILAMEQKIIELSSQVEDSRVRERRRELECAGLKAQFDALRGSGGIPPCSSVVTFPPRPSQSEPTQYSVYDQQRNMTDESISDEEDDDHMADTLPH